MDNDTIEILKLIASFLTPVIILIIGILINRNLEKNKVNLSKEKEWHTYWAELLLKCATELNSNISLIVCYLYESGGTDDRNKQAEYGRMADQCRLRIITLGWDIKNYTQFANINGEGVIKNLDEILDKLHLLLRNRGGNLEEVRKIQFEYNVSVRKAHGEILKLKS